MLSFQQLITIPSNFAGETYIIKIRAQHDALKRAMTYKSIFSILLKVSNALSYKLKASPD
jgi:hypothetical protein